MAVASGCSAAHRSADAAERLCRTLGIGEPTLTAARERSARNGISVERELMACGAIDPAAFYREVAAMLNVPFLASIAPEKIIVSRHLDSVLARPERVSAEIDGQLRHVVAPAAGQIARLEELIAANPATRNRLAVATPAAIRSAVWNCRSEARACETARALFEQNMSESARTVVTGRQGFVFGLILAGAAAAAFLAPSAALLLLHLVLSSFFLSCVGLRAAALASFRKPGSCAMPRADGPFPRYTVLVALYEEAAMVPQLVASLSRLEWPRSLIEFKLVCEADDAATIEAAEALQLPQEFEIIKVPAVGPRTKPKALQYALSGVGGDYLVIYDAEDRPHPEQLLEAHATFQQSAPRVAYLQAPLVITNARGSTWAAVFALEYAALFRGLLPFLARRQLPLPLGGTSNHFRGLM